MIDGKPYGTTCAEAKLGVRLPQNFSGDYNKYAKKQKINHDAQIDDFERRKEITRKAWGDMVSLSKAMIKARRNGNDWEVNFIGSIADQVGLALLRLPEDRIKDTMDATYEDENWKLGGGGTRTYYYNHPKGFDSLSDKQLSILDRILS